MAEARELTELTETTFDEVVGGSPVPVVVDFWAEWCPPCHMLTPVLHEIAAEHADELRVFSVDTDAHPGLGARYGVMSLPTLLVFDGGTGGGNDGAKGAEPVKRLVGARGKRHLLAELSDVLGRHESARTG
jgi:thioredoxin 1